MVHLGLRRHLPHGAVKEHGYFEKYGPRWFFVRTGYLVDERAYEGAKAEFVELQRKTLERWRALPRVFRLVSLLKKAWDGKRRETYLDRAVALAREINLPFFSWGCKEPDDDRGGALVFFQIGEERACFHANQVRDAPEFGGPTNGSPEFPFSVTKVKRLAILHGMQVAEIKARESEPFASPPTTRDWPSR
ncbi:MAG: hypothetical protein Kow0069_32760 [Promethearchaeota archaeon]